MAIPKKKPTINIDQKGRFDVENIFKAVPGGRNQTRSIIQEPLDAWNCLFDNTLLKYILPSTNERIELEGQIFTMTEYINLLDWFI